MNRFRKAAGAALALAALLSIVPAAQAETIKFTATLNGQNEVPPVKTPAAGHAEIALDTVSRTLTWTVDFRGLTSEFLSAHFHGQASATENAPIMLPIGKRGDKSPLKGSKVLPPGQVAGLMAGRWYINVHTPIHPPGEIRGQVVRQ